jgi:inhibitor of KinA
MERLVPLGDQAALVYFADELAAMRFAAALRRAKDPWLVDVVGAYTCVAVFFNLDHLNFAAVAARLREIEEDETESTSAVPACHHRIPCCYEKQLDLARVAEHTGLSSEEIIRLHTGTEYTVYAIGFCPGFPYLGYLPPALCNVPRLPAPRVRVEAGSVGLTGRQTGIYTEARPGGWNLIGRTPLELVNVEDEYFPLRAGDKVQFEQIDETRFEELLGERLPQG